MTRIIVHKRFNTFGCSFVPHVIMEGFPLAAILGYDLSSKWNCVEMKVIPTKRGFTLSFPGSKLDKYKGQCLDSGSLFALDRAVYLKARGCRLRLCRKDFEKITGIVYDGRRDLRFERYKRGGRVGVRIIVL